MENFHHLIYTPLVPVDDVQSMAQALKSLVTKPIRRQQYDLSKYDQKEKMLEIEQFYILQIDRLNCK